MKAANDHWTEGSGSVFKDLDLAPTEAEWAALCEKNGASLPYPFAKVLQFPLTPSPMEREK